MSAFESAASAAAVALTAMLAEALPEVEVTDGPPVAGSDAMEALAVGWSPAEDSDHIEVTSEPGGMSGDIEAETIAIHCSLAVLAGDRDVPDIRARAYQILAATRRTIAADPKLRRTVMRARVPAHSLRQADTSAGTLARINFTVTAAAFTSR